MLRGQITLRGITIWGNRIPQLSAVAVHVRLSMFTSIKGDPSTAEYTPIEVSRESLPCVGTSPFSGARSYFPRW